MVNVLFGIAMVLLITGLLIPVVVLIAIFSVVCDTYEIEDNNSNKPKHNE